MMRLRDESGMTLLELLVAMTLSLIVFTATLNAFDSFGKTNGRNSRANQQQDTARQAVDRLTKQLRNLASPTNGQETIALATSTAIIFQTTEPNKQWVGYCLINSPSPASNENGILYYQSYRQSNGVASAPPSTTCPDPTNWTKADPSDPDPVVKLVDHVTNNIGTARPLFTYRSLNSSAALATPANTATRPQIARVNVAMFLDLNHEQPPAETTLNSEVFLRNQNQPPIAAFRVFRGSGNTYTLDGGSSSDPQGRTLAFNWYVSNQVPNPLPDLASLPDCGGNNPPVVSNLTCIGTGPLLVHDFTNDPFQPASGSTPKNTKLFLRVTDPGGLSDISEPNGSSCPRDDDPTRSQQNCESVRVQ